MTIKALKDIFQDELAGIYPKEEGLSFFYLLCEAYLNTSRIDIALTPILEIRPDIEASFLKALEQLKIEFPIQYIIGETEFMDLVFEVNEQVLIPRPETEELISWILNTSSKKLNNTILDIGTGSGCIPIVLAKNLPESSIEAIDVSVKALEIAKKNAIRNKVHIKFIHKDILKIDALQNSYDVIVSNPPYVRESEKKLMQNNVLKYEPDLALYVSDSDPLIFYKQISKLAAKGLKPNGYLYFEINQYLGADICELLTGMDFKNIELKKDIYGVDRMIRAVKI
jgi:release factor glutamine methyltransferase